MKCPYCGAPLGLDDKFCPYCGQPNTLAKKHQADIKNITGNFRKPAARFTGKPAGSPGWRSPSPYFSYSFF